MVDNFFEEDDIFDLEDIFDELKRQGVTGQGKVLINQNAKFNIC